MPSDRKTIRQKFLRCLGKWPEAPVKKVVQFLRRTRDGATTRYLISYKVEPGETIEAWWKTKPGAFRLSLYPGRHERNAAMVRDATEFLQRWL